MGECGARCGRQDRRARVCHGRRAVAARDAGNDLPASKFAADGIVQPGTTKDENRGIATVVRVWNSEKCTTCNLCSLYSTHGAIRPFLLNDEEAAKAPESFTTTNMKCTGDVAKSKFRVHVFTLDCAVCTTACPTNCLTTKDIGEVHDVETKNGDNAMTLPARNELADRRTSAARCCTTYLEFSGVLEGFNETALVKLLTQLFGERLMIANVTGCSSIWGGTWGTNPSTVDAKGYGPAWVNSLFEDNAEYGFGMFLATQRRRNLRAQLVTEAVNFEQGCDKMKALLREWLEKKEDAVECEHLYKILPMLEGASDKCVLCKKIHTNSDLFIKLTQSIISGDGWAYDIGYNCIDHVLASGNNANTIVLDTEMYSNMGGQKHGLRNSKIKCSVSPNFYVYFLLWEDLL